MKFIAHPIEQDVRFPLPRVNIAVYNICKAAGEDEKKYNCGVGNIVENIVLFQDIIRKAIEKCGKISVRYVGDLKESHYPISANLFIAQLGESDFVETLRKSIVKGDRKSYFINLANVRDIVFNLGDHTSLSIEDDITYMNNVINVVRTWPSAIIKDIK